MSVRALHDGRDDGLTPLKSLDLGKIHSFSDLLLSMRETAFSGRSLGDAYDILVHMAKDEDCKVILTISGAMTVAKQGYIICELIDRGIVQGVIATGALIAHGLTESIGLAHYRCSPDHSDEELFEKGYNRIYDTLEMESNLNEVAQLMARVLENTTPESGYWSSAELCKALGKELSRLAVGPGILRSAYEKNVPVFIPAFTDSEIGLDMATWAINNQLAQQEKSRDSLSSDQVFSTPPPFNPFQDLLQYTRLIQSAKKVGILTIGGGVPRNWAQQVGPFVDITNHRTGTDLKAPRFQYGVRICPEPVHWGGLSGCTYSEGVSWGKFVPHAEGGRYSEVYADATVVFPLLAKAVFETLEK
ncbi:MAG: deoxyhypusine synthase family protein [Planctomycetaceae bacterium]